MHDIPVPTLRPTNLAIVALLTDSTADVNADLENKDTSFNTTPQSNVA